MRSPFVNIKKSETISNDPSKLDKVILAYEN